MTKTSTDTQPNRVKTPVAAQKQEILAAGEVPIATRASFCNVIRNGRGVPSVPLGLIGIDV